MKVAIIDGAVREVGMNEGLGKPITAVGASGSNHCPKTPLSVVESCRRLKVSVRDYFSTILPGLADLPIRCLPDLTPAVWVARHS
jgi:hypothetical protein